MKTPPIPPPWREFWIKISLGVLCIRDADGNLISGDPRLVQAVAIAAWEAEAERAEQKAYFQAVNNAKEWRKWKV